MYERIRVTHAQAKKQLEEEIIRRENEVLSGEHTSPVEGLGQTEGEASSRDAPSDAMVSSSLTQEQRRSIRQQMGKHGLSRKGGLTAHTLELSTEELKKLQAEDDTLAKVREAADGHPKSAGVGFFK